MRKYFTEFCLHTYTSFKAILPINAIEDYDDGRVYSIYMILGLPKVRYVNGSFISGDKGISFDYFIIKDGVESKVEVREHIIFPDFDHSYFKITCNFPFETITITLNRDYCINRLLELYKFPSPTGMSVEEVADHMIEVLSSPYPVYAWYKERLSNMERMLEAKVLYVGQTQGKDGKRTAQQRLSSHSTFQKILSDTLTTYQDRQLMVLLLEISNDMHISMDGTSKVTHKTMDEDDIHWREALVAEYHQKQIINITEAALINYYKPHYNVNFVENFPNSSHLTYKQYYDLDFNSIVVELDLDFDTGKAPVVLVSDTIESSSVHELISFELDITGTFSSMYEIFGNRILP